MNSVGDDAANKLINLSIELGRVGIAAGGQLAKEILLAVLQKVKETEENRTGLMSAKKLLKSKDELAVVDLAKEHLPIFKSLAREMNIPHSIITSKGSNEAKIMYKAKDVEIMKNIMQTILKDVKDKSEKDNLDLKEIFDMLKNVIFKNPNDDKNMFYETKLNSQEKALALKELLKVSNIKSQVILNNIDKNGRYEVEYMFDEKDKDKATEILDVYKKKTLKEILDEINKISGKEEREEEKPKEEEKGEEEREEEKPKEEERGEEEREKEKLKEEEKVNDSNDEQKEETGKQSYKERVAAAEKIFQENMKKTKSEKKSKAKSKKKER